MQPSENPLVVFVSSVQRPEVDDLGQERRTTIEAIKSLQLARPWAFEEAPASAEPVEQSYLNKVKECDLFVILVGRDLTDAVEQEWRTATAHDKPRLVFLKEAIDRSDRAKRWIAAEVDVKYDRFSSTQDLRGRVESAVIDEVVRGYRQYRLRNEDYRSLAKTVRSAAVSFVVRTIRADELTEISGEFPQLAELYPAIDEWIAQKRADVVTGKAEAYVAAYEGANAGFAVTAQKEESVRKLSTLYIKPEYQGLGVGPRLLYDVILKAANDGCEKLYVTVAEERREELAGLLSHCGFQAEGVSPRRYRSGSWEWVWGKRLVHGVLRWRDLRAFTETYLLQERGYEVRNLDGRYLMARRRVDATGRTSNCEPPFLVAVSTGADSDEAYEEACEAADQWGVRLIFVAGDVPQRRRDRDICLGAYDLEAMFFPLYVRRETSGLIVPIREEFVRDLIPSTEQRQFFAPTRVQLRTDNVYYRSPKLYDDLKQGAPILFYETARAVGASRLLGEAKLVEWRVDEPRELFAVYGNLGVYTLERLESAAASARGENEGKVLGLKFDWYRAAPRPLTLGAIQAIIPKYYPITARSITCEQALALRGSAGWNVSELSFQ